MAKKNLGLFDSEWAILRVVWKLEPCAAPTVQEELQDERGWAYTTVKTMMDRMVKKGLLEAEKIRTLYFYKASVTSAQAKKSEIAKALRLTFNGALAPMMEFLIEDEEISDAELDELDRIGEEVVDHPLDLNRIQIYGCQVLVQVHAHDKLLDLELGRHVLGQVGDEAVELQSLHLQLALLHLDHGVLVDREEQKAQHQCGQQDGKPVVLHGVIVNPQQAEEEPA